MRTLKWTMAICVILCACEQTASAQAFVASIGRVYGGDSLSRTGTWAVSLGGAGAHSIGSELEYSQTSHFSDLLGRESKVLTVMASVYLAVPVHAVKPYGIFGYGFIRQRTATSEGGILSDLSNDDVGYSAGGGVTYQFARSVGVRADLRHFKVRTSDGLSFQRFMVGIVLGG